MALLDALVPNASADIVAVFDDQFNQVFVNARPIKGTVNESAKVMEHPVETGATITDHIIFQPIEIELSLMLTSADYRSVYQQIKDIYLAGRLLTVQTRTSTHQNMLIQQLPREESTDVFNGISVALRLKEANFVTAQFGSLPEKSVANKSQSSTVARGQQQTTEKTSPPSSTLKTWFGS